MSHTPAPWDENFKFHSYSELIEAYVLDEDEFLRAQTCVNACAPFEDPDKTIPRILLENEELNDRVKELEQLLNAIKD